MRTSTDSLFLRLLSSDHLSHHRLNLVELLALEKSLVPSLQFIITKLLVKISHMLLQVHDLLMLWKNGVGDGGCGGFELLVDSCNLLGNLSALLESLLKPLIVFLELLDSLLLSLDPHL